MATEDYAHHFSERNIPFGIASSVSHERPQAVTRIENTVVFLQELHSAGVFSGVTGLNDGAFLHPSLNTLAAHSRSVIRSVREAIIYAFEQGGLDAFPKESKADVADVQMHLPVEIGDFVGLYNPVIDTTGSF